MATHEQVAATNLKFPNMTAAEIAARLSCSTAYVRATAYRRGIPIPGITVKAKSAAALPRLQMFVDVSETEAGEPHARGVDLADCYDAADIDAFNEALKNLQATGLHIEGGGAAAVSYLRRSDPVQA